MSIDVCVMAVAMANKPVPFLPPPSSIIEVITRFKSPQLRRMLSELNTLIVITVKVNCLKAFVSHINKISKNISTAL